MKIQTIIMLIGFYLALPLISADQIIWNNDSNILIQDIWEDITGLPLTVATCNWTVYNSDGSINQSGTHGEIAPGVFNLTINQLPIGNYPFLFNCTKNSYNGTSSIREIKIVDELTEDFKDSIDQINTTVIEINKTTHLTYDLLVGEINDTLQTILTTTNFTKENLTQINNRLDSILSNTNLLIEKWGSEDADDIIDLIKDLSEQIRDLEFRIEFVSSGELESRMLSITSTTKSVFNKLNETEGTNFWFWFWVFIGGFVILLIILILYSVKKNG